MSNAEGERPEVARDPDHEQQVADLMERSHGDETDGSRPENDPHENVTHGFGAELLQRRNAQRLLLCVTLLGNIDVWNHRKENVVDGDRRSPRDKGLGSASHLFML